MVHMRHVCLSTVVIALVWGCSSPEVSGGGFPPAPAPNADEVGQVKQRAQFADATVLNIVDMGTSAWLNLAADGDAVTVQIYYIGDKTTDAGHQPSTAVLVDTLSIPSDTVRTHSINLSHPAFAGGYGSILADAVGVSPTTVFQTYLGSTPANVLQDVGGSVFQGTSYRIPVARGASKIVLAVTNQSDFQYDILFANVSGPGSHTVTLVPLTTYKFDSSQHGFVWPGTSAPGPGSLQIFTQASGTAAVSGYVLVGTTKYRVAPVKAAAFL